MLLLQGVTARGEFGIGEDAAVSAFLLWSGVFESPSPLSAALGAHAQKGPQARRPQRARWLSINPGHPFREL